MATEYTSIKDAVKDKAAYPGYVPATDCNNLVSQQAADGNPDQAYYDETIEAYINEKGYPLLYYPYMFNVDKSETLYGEHSAARYAVPMDIIMFIEIKDAPSFVTAYGFDNTDTVSGWLHIRTFREKIEAILQNPRSKQYGDYSKIYNLNYIADKDVVHAIEPKPDDLIQLVTLGVDRAWNRGNKIYQITSVEDEIYAENFNFAGGHYCWRITAKRYRFSHEGGTSTLDTSSPDAWNLDVLGEKGNQQVFDSQSVMKMFLTDSSLETENLYDMECEDGIGMGHAEDGAVIDYGKVYCQSDKADSVNVYDMDNLMPGFYDNIIENYAELHPENIVYEFNK